MQELEKIIGYKFNDKKILERALTHSSYTKKSDTPDNNERLEFLGDAVLELIISEFLFKNYKKMDEGNLSRFRSKIVCETSLALIAKKINLGKFLKLSHGEEINGGREKNSILSDATEALFAAIFLDSNFATAKNFILNLITNTKEIMDTNNIVDAKSRLQEIFQEKSEIPLVYEIIDESGPAHEKIYVAQVSHENKILGQGHGHSKKEAEQEAAIYAINNLA